MSEAWRLSRTSSGSTAHYAVSLTGRRWPPRACGTSRYSIGELAQSLNPKRFGTKHPCTIWFVITELQDMRHTKPPTTRNKIDVADASQIRILKKRLGVSSDDLHRIVMKVGNSIAAVTKEIESRKPLPLTAPAPVENDSVLPSPVGVTALV
jgi:hypothetical protein